MQLPNCACRNRYTVQNVNVTTNKVDSSFLESSVEATGLDDIPGRVISFSPFNNLGKSILYHVFCIVFIPITITYKSSNFIKLTIILF